MSATDFGVVVYEASKGLEEDYSGALFEISSPTPGVRDAWVSLMGSVGWGEDEKYTGGNVTVKTVNYSMSVRGTMPS